MHLDYQRGGIVMGNVSFDIKRLLLFLLKLVIGVVAGIAFLTSASSGYGSGDANVVGALAPLGLIFAWQLVWSGLTGSIVAGSYYGVMKSWFANDHTGGFMYGFLRFFIVLLIAVFFGWYNFARELVTIIMDITKNKKPGASVRTKNSIHKKTAQTVETNEQENNIIYFNDADGNKKGFEVLDVIKYERKEFVVFLPVLDEGEEDEGSNVLILRMETGPGNEESFFDVDDDEMVQKVYGQFQSKYRDTFEFTS